jgi:hypothetical protein
LILTNDILLSSSAIAVYMRCGEKYRRRYIEGEMRPSSLSMHVGTAAHEVERETHRRQMEAKKDAGLEGLTYAQASTDDKATELGVVLAASVMSTAEAGDLAADEFEKAAEAGFSVPQDTELAELPVAKAKGEAKDAAVRHARAYAPHARTINPLSIERWIEVRPKNSRIVLRGAIDLIDGTWDGAEVVDRKTSTKTPNQSTASSSIQLSIYAALRYAETRDVPPKLRLDTTVDLKSGTKFVQTATTRSFADVKEVLDRAVQVGRGIAAGAFVPADPEQWWCSAKFCEYYTDCKFTAGRRLRSS